MPNNPKIFIKRRGSDDSNVCICLLLHIKTAYCCYIKASIHVVFNGEGGKKLLTLF